MDQIFKKSFLRKVREKLKSAANPDSSVNFLKSKGNLKTRVDERLAELSGAKGVLSKLKAMNRKVMSKEISTEDLPDTHDTLLAKGQGIVKGLEEIKSKLPTVKKTGLPQHEMELDNSKDEFSATWQTMSMF
jgi:hypothetical protein